MSQFYLLEDIQQPYIDIPCLHQTLLFIQTDRYLPANSAVSLEHKIPQRSSDSFDSQLSLDLKLENGQNDTIFSASTLKKKKAGCNCKKTKCLKMYCQCFSQGKMCTPQCSCFSCSNDHNHLDCIDNAKSMIKAKMSNTNKQGKGCTCKRTQCQKKYCECFNSGISCTQLCKCQDCANGSCSSHSYNDIKNQKEEN